MKSKCAQEMIDLLPYVDFLFSNRNEAIAFAGLKGYKVLTKIIYYLNTQKYIIIII
jgi:hypothetical protein